MSERQRPFRVLIVDNSPVVREALRWALEETGDTVIVGEVSDGVAAIEKAERLLPDLVLLDSELSATNGYALARSLKHLPNPPRVIFLSVHGDLATRQQAQDAGGDAFIEKSTGWPPLIRQIRRLFRPTDSQEPDLD